MKVVLLHNRYQHLGGEEIVLQQEYELLSLNTHHVTCAILKNDLLKGVFLKIEAALHTACSPTGFKFAKDAIAIAKPDIVHVHNFFPLLTPSVYDACIEAGVPVVQTLHNYRTICANALFLRKGRVCEKCRTGSPWQAVLHRCYRKSLAGSWALANMIAYHRKRQTWQKKANRFISLTEFSRGKFISVGFPPEKIVVKPNFVEDPLRSKNLVHHSHNGKALFVGRLSPEKGVDILIKAWRKIHYSLEIAGTGPLFSELKKNAPDNITFLGQLSKEEVIHKMMESSFLIMPSICYEGFPLVIVEAFACGLPVVASRLGSMEEIIQDGITGMHFKAGNADDLAEKVNAMFASPERLIQMGINARNEYEAKYTPEKNYELLMGIYNTVIEEHKAGGYSKPI